MLAILRGGGWTQMPVSPSIRVARDAERQERADQRLLQVAAVALHVLAVPRQVEDRVADELAGPVVGRLAAAVGLDDLDLGAVGDVQLARLGAPAERDHRRVLEQQHRVGHRAARDRVREAALHLPALLVSDGLAQVVDVPGAAHARSVAACAAARTASPATVIATTTAPAVDQPSARSSHRKPATAVTPLPSASARSPTVRHRSAHRESAAPSPRSGARRSPPERGSQLRRARQSRRPAARRCPATLRTGHRPERAIG